jgi:hypothetical protein
MNHGRFFCPPCTPLANDPGAGGLLSLTACDQLGIETPGVVAAKKEAEGRAIGSACRHAVRSIEDCYASNPRASKAAIFTGWREMDEYMRENDIAGMPASPVPSGEFHQKKWCHQLPWRQHRHRTTPRCRQPRLPPTPAPAGSTTGQHRDGSIAGHSRSPKHSASTCALSCWIAVRPTYQTRSNTAMLSTWAVCGNMLTTPAAVQR